MAGFSDLRQRLCLSLALWNGHDPILKERLFGLTNSEGNHGEDVKEQYFYLDASPSHSYLRMLYKYPHAAFPYLSLVEENRRRGVGAMEFELLDTGVFADNRYFDVFVEYAQAEPGEILMKVTAHNRGAQAATLHLLPQLLLRNTWAWDAKAAKPTMRLSGAQVQIEHAELGTLYAHADLGAWIFTDNESNNERLWGAEHHGGYFKDGFHERIVGSQKEATNPNQYGTKAGAWSQQTVPALAQVSVRVHLGRQPSASSFADFDRLLGQRKDESAAFYDELQQGIKSEDERLVQRQAFAGLIWSKQYFNIDIPTWLDGDPTQIAPPEARKYGRNADWRHLNNADIVSMPDKWEYPWYASWDLAFHCIPFSLIDAAFAKQQLILLTREWFMHPNGQIPAYEWAFGDVNPPVHAWSAWRVYQRSKAKRRHGRCGLSRARVSQIDVEFHLVGKSQRCRRPQRVPGRLSRTRQYRRV